MGFETLACAALGTADFGRIAATATLRTQILADWREAHREGGRSEGHVKAAVAFSFFLLLGGARTHRYRGAEVLQP